MQHLFCVVLIGLWTLFLCSGQTPVSTRGTCRTELSVDGIQGDVLPDLCTFTPYRNLGLVLTCKDQRRSSCVQPVEFINLDVCNKEEMMSPKVPISISSDESDHQDSNLSMDVSLVVHSDGDVDEVDVFQLHSNLQSHAPVTRIELIGSYRKTRIQIALHRTCSDPNIRLLHRSRRSNKLGQSVKISIPDSEAEFSEKQNRETVKIKIPDNEVALFDKQERETVSIGIPLSEAELLDKRNRETVKIGIPGSEAIVSGREEMVFSGEGEQIPTSLEQLVKDSLHRLQEQMADVSKTSSRISGQANHATELAITSTTGSSNVGEDFFTHVLTEQASLAVTSDIPDSSTDTEVKAPDRSLILTTLASTTLPPVSTFHDIMLTTTPDSVTDYITASSPQKSAIVYVPTKTLHDSSRLYHRKPMPIGVTARRVTLTQPLDSTNLRVKLPSVISSKEDADLSKILSHPAMGDVLSKETLGEPFVAEANEDVPRVVEEINDQDFLQKLMDSLRNKANENPVMGPPTPLAFSRPNIPTSVATSQSSIQPVSSTPSQASTPSGPLTPSTSLTSSFVISSARPIPETDFPTSVTTTWSTTVQDIDADDDTPSPLVGVPPGKPKSDTSTTAPSEILRPRSTLATSMNTDPPSIATTVSIFADNPRANTTVKTTTVKPFATSVPLGSKLAQSLPTVNGNTGRVTTKAVTPESLITLTKAVTPESLITLKKAVTPESLITLTNEVTPESLITLTKAVTPESLITLTKAVTPESLITLTKDVTPESLITLTNEDTPESVITLTTDPSTTDSVSVTSPNRDDSTTDSQPDTPADQEHVDVNIKSADESDTRHETGKTTTPLSTVFLSTTKTDVVSSTLSSVSSLPPTKGTSTSTVGGVTTGSSKSSSTSLTPSLNTVSSEMANTTTAFAPTTRKGKSTTTTSTVTTTPEVEHLPGQTPGPLLATSSESKSGHMSVSGDPGNDDTFWPVVAALVIGIPSVIVFGIAITVIHKRRLGHPTRVVASSMYPSL